MRKDEFGYADCWYKDVCDKCPGGCDASCIRFLEMLFLFEQSGLPRCHWYPTKLIPEDCDLAAFQDLQYIKDNIRGFVESGQNLYIYSHNTGNGKTTWSIKLLQKYFDEVWDRNGLRCRGVFVNVPTLLVKLKNFKVTDPEVERLKQVLPTVDLVVWDDMGMTNMSNYDYGQLSVLLEERIMNKKANIYTSNYSEDALVKNIGPRLASRVWYPSQKIEFVGGDNRQW